MIPFILVPTFSILLTLAFGIPGIVMCIRWMAMLGTRDSDIGVGDMKIPTFYASHLAQEPENPVDVTAVTICMPVVGVVFGGIHCVGL